jgi:competence CoiA-like predicted nuclease
VEKLLWEPFGTASPRTAGEAVPKAPLVGCSKLMQLEQKLLAQEPFRELVYQKTYRMHILPISRTIASTGFEGVETYRDLSQAQISSQGFYMLNDMLQTLT